ncbi:hypothetical protein F4677DRAFT_250435 [Hypoxylon crocopeplum]|nr:hypothetical protein F4677DRAFT_250435 [Hypoxylon crocopeplum]
MSHPNTDADSQYVGDNLQVHGAQSAQPYARHDGLASHPLLTTSIPPYSSNIYAHHGPSGFVQPSNSVNQNPSLSTETSLAQNVSWSSAAQPVPQTTSFDFRLAAGGTPVSLPGATPMRYLHTNLAVLSAEEYDGGRYSRRSASKVNPKPTTTVIPVDNAPNPKKRGRKPADVDQRESEEEPKRARGRPRLETKDQTPSERRRTQIRLAQRAYRNRKENAITDLQAKINDLRDVNNEINNAYHNLFDYASQRGLLAQAPEFGQQLQRLQELIKQTQEDKDSPRGSESGSPEADLDDGVREARRVEDVPAAHDESVPTQPEAQTTHLWAGLTVSHEPVVQPELPAALSNLDPALNNPQAQEYEIITAPTLDNASFGPNLSLDANFLSPAQASWAENPWNRLTGPRSLSFNEWAFARRLHRNALERAAALITMPSPPPARLSRVFGFVMLFETVDEIRARTMTSLDRIRDEPLNYWEHPFHQLGGSGTHFSGQGAGPSSLAGSSTYESTGFGTGPFNERTTRVRDTFLGVSQYINMSGWEGTWFDSGEVETYLAQNGVVIPTSADIHTVELQPGAFSDVQSQPQIQLMQTIPPNTASALHVSTSFNPDLSGNASSGMGNTTFAAEPSTSGNVDPSSTQGDIWAPISVTSNLYGTTQPEDGSIPSFTGFDNMAANVFANPSSYLFPHHEPPPAAPKRVVLDVNNFLDRLISHATCLGRAPAFRPKDIVSSFWDAVIAD